MEVKGQDYEVRCDPETAVITFRGTLELASMTEYQPIVTLLNGVVNQKPPIITLNLRELEFVNSSALSIILRFGINIRKKNASQLVVQGSKRYSWQKKSLKNMQRFVRNVKFDFDKG